ncbi:MAG TPA: hypothetical protein VK781_08640 [Solirubrobacteraceae bacterium]|jgi:hypothetical protein|nr:hypothetical protein [Solirubrobacteraceae bacterium]
MLSGRNLIATLAVIAVAAVGAAVLLVSSHGHGRTGSPPVVVQPGVKTLQGSVFSTSYDAGWVLSSKRDSIGAAQYQLSSTGAAINPLGIAPAGTVAITINETPESFFSSAHTAGVGPDLAVRRQSAVQLLPHIVGTPRGAQRTILASRPQRSKLAGVEAAIESYGYTYAGTGNIQVDVLSRKHGDIVLLELNTEPSLSSQGEAALEAIAKHWRWR